MTAPCITFNNLVLGYGRRPALLSLTGVVAQGSLTAVVGANGSGKSTLIKGIAGLLRPMAGSCTLARDARPAYLPQRSELDRLFPARVADLVALGLWPQRGLLGHHGRADRATMASALATVGLQGFEHRPLDTLSGGQLQRALFARVLLQDAALILLDEPFNAVDAHTRAALLALIQRWHTEGRTVLVVVHDLDLVRTYFPEALLLARAPVAWGDARATLSATNLLRARDFEPDGQRDGTAGAPRSARAARLRQPETA